MRGGSTTCVRELPSPSLGEVARQQLGGQALASLGQHHGLGLAHGVFDPPPLVQEVQDVPVQAFPCARFVSAAECGEREDSQRRLCEFVVIEAVWKCHVASEDQSWAGDARSSTGRTGGVAVQT